jgi:hypothetical protein
MGNGYFTGAVLFSWVVILSAAFIVSRIPKMSEFARFTWTQVVLFGGVIATFNWFSVSLAPMPNRYELEAQTSQSHLLPSKSSGCFLDALGLPSRSSRCQRQRTKR